MESLSLLAVQSQTVPDRAVLLAGLEATRAAYDRFLDAASRGRWHDKSPNSAWTLGEVLVHLAWALEHIPEEVELARRGKGKFNMPKWFADPASYWLIRWQARKSDPEAVRRRYHAAMDATIVALEIVPDTDWSLGAPFYGHGFHTITRLFQIPAEHLAEHTLGW